MSLPDFISLSEYLLGIPLEPPLVPSPITDLDPGLAQTYFTNLLSPDNGPAIPNQQPPPGVIPPGGTTPDPNWAITPAKMDQLLAVWAPISAMSGSAQQQAFESRIQNDAFLWPLAQQIVIAWYTGVCANVPRSADLYESTLVWLLAQAHPMGVPLSFGYWQYPPGGAA